MVSQLDRTIIDWKVHTERRERRIERNAYTRALRKVEMSFLKVYHSEFGLVLPGQALELKWGSDQAGLATVITTNYLSRC